MEQQKDVKTKKIKKTWPENECPKFRWVVAVILGFIVANIVGAVVSGILDSYYADGFIRCSEGTFNFIKICAVFASYFWFTLLFIKKIAKTRPMSFILGSSRKVNMKQVWIVALFTIGGIILGCIVDLPNISLNKQIDINELIFSVIFSALFIWMQSGVEEIWFRGILGRMFFSDNLKQGINVKSVIYVLISVVLFSLAHGYNPEVTTSKGIEVLFAFMSYGVVGFVFCFVTLYYGSLLPAIVIHSVNNFLGSWLVGGEVSVLETPKILIDKTESHAAFRSFLTVILTYAPLIIYLIIKRKKEKNESAV